jgi:phosphoribosyl-ATP pyrophosphohydrolase/phosphoribosyl-AMP cyclohydrolase/histidinol dehydrogenase
LLAVSLDCDRDALRFTVRQEGSGFCHTGSVTCWGAAPPLTELESLLQSRALAAPTGSYTRRLLDDPALLAAKLVEEAEELGAAEERNAVLEESADLIYFTLVRLAGAGASLADVERALARRARAVTRRPGHARRPRLDS